MLLGYSLTIFFPNQCKFLEKIYLWSLKFGSSFKEVCLSKNVECMLWNLKVERDAFLFFFFFFFFNMIPLGAFFLPINLHQEEWEKIRFWIIRVSIFSLLWERGIFLVWFVSLFQMLILKHLFWGIFTFSPLFGWWKINVQDIYLFLCQMTFFNG